MKSFERYRRYAADCLKMAQSAANDGDKARLLQMAETWRHLAELAEAQAAAKDDDCTLRTYVNVRDAVYWSPILTTA